ncbi:MAG: amidohydrolase [Clostridia bacterium]
MRKIFFGTVITMEEALYQQAVLVEDGVIVKVGDQAALQGIAPDAEMIDLAGGVLLPAFIDAHGHFSSYANAQMQATLEGADCLDEIARRIAAFMEANQVKKGDWVVAKGYDHNALGEKRHPDRALLDRVAPDNPLILQHQSGHCGVLNSRALDALQISLDTPAPAGGVIGRADGQLTGYMEEDAYIACIKRVPMAKMSDMLAAYEKAQRKYLAEGILTVQEGMMVAQMLPLYESLIASGLLKIDVVGYPDVDSMRAIAQALPDSVKQYNRHFKIGGYKVILDGSPQVKTAWMKTPYQGEADNFGYGTMPEDALISAVERATKEKMQILAHGNGDAAIEEFLGAVEEVSKRDARILNLRPVIIHAQMMTRAQLAKAADLRVIPSFFVAHVRYWGDIHVKNFGLDRARSISPAGSALKAGVRFTFHQDAPVIEPNMIETIACAVTRKTQTGAVLGKDERIGVLDALKAVTINAAYQYFEEDQKGSIREGKRADFVVLSADPLKVAPDAIAQIQVLQTIKAGETVFQAVAGKAAK